MKTISVGIPGREYEINIGKGILDSTADIIDECVRNGCAGRKVAIVTDSNVGPLYSERLVTTISKARAIPEVITVPAGEASKSQNCLDIVYEKLLNMEITRSDIIIALGGGVVGDLTGFAAATILRGVPYVQIPTSLLAQVDSSVGGKVAINHMKGKNLIGAFYQPIAVIADIDCLNTLEKRFFYDGMAEVIKYGMALDKGLFGLLENGYNDMQDIVARCCDIKRYIVEADERDMGLRMKLNFGHTFGHAVEKYYNFEKYTHGEAVAIGMVMACGIGEEMGITPFGIGERLKRLIRTYNLPVSCDAEVEELARLVLGDKKRDMDTINLILTDNIGSCVIHRVETSLISKMSKFLTDVLRNEE